jgi:parvulin-like peptidyl-prolyl isomerase
MRISRYPVLYLIFLFIFLWAGCKSEMLSEDDPQNNIVAKYGDNYTVTFSELSKYVSDWFYSHKFKNRSVAYNNALNDLLINQFKRMDFFAKGLDKNEKLIQSISRTINEELVAEYFENQYVDKYANIEEAKTIYKIMDKQVIAQQIVLYKPENASLAHIDSIQQKAMKIKSEIEEGKDFNSIIRQYSQDEQSLNNNGFMPPVDWKQSILDPVGNAIFSLHKNDVRVLNDVDAFRIVKIEEVKKIHVEPFDEIKNEIILFLKNAYYQVSIDEYEKDKKELIDENSLEWNDNALKQLVKWSDEPNFYKDKYEETFENALANNDNKTILIYNKGKVDYKEYLRLLNNILILPSSKNNITEDDLKYFILEAIRTDMIVNRANSLDLKKNILNPFTKNITLKNKLAYLYNQAEIEAKIPDTTYEALHQFFRENENTLYYQLEKKNIFVMVFANKDEAENASEKIKQGIPFEKVKGSYLVKTYIKERNGEINSFSNDEKPVFGEVAFKMKESEVSAPIKFEDENNLTKYAILKCYYIRPEKQLTFSDVKNSIAEDFKNYYREKIGKDVEEKLKNKYHPEIFEDVLTKALSSN